MKTEKRNGSLLHVIHHLCKRIEFGFRIIHILLIHLIGNDREAVRSRETNDHLDVLVRQNSTRGVARIDDNNRHRMGFGGFRPLDTIMQTVLVQLP